MKTFIVFLSVFLRLNHANPIDDPSLSFILDGQDAEEGEFPHQLSLEKNNDGEWKHTCGAVLINKHQALTATHCVRERKSDSHKAKSDFRIVAGLHDKRKMNDTQVVMLKEIIMEPNYFDPVAIMSNDLSILTFSGPLELNDRVQPIVWNQDDSVTFAGDQCVISGWGKTTKQKTSDPKFSPNVLQKVTMEVLSNEECKKKMDKFNTKIYSGHICVYKPSHGSGRGDSGGPMTCQHDGQAILAGVTSFSIRLSYVDPSVYSRVSYFQQFILDNLVDE